MNYSTPERLQRFQNAALMIGMAALALCVIGAFLGGAKQFFISYLFAFLFWLGLSLGCLGVAMIHHLTGGAWGDVTRRFLEAGYQNLWLLAILFVPVLFGLRELYPWMQPELVAASEILQHKAHYLNVPGFVGRAVFYFAVWMIFANRLRKWSLKQDQTEDLEPTRRARALSGPGIVIYPLVMTFASIDWVMSLEADWYSTMFPIIICIGQILSAYAFVIIMAAAFREHPSFASRLKPKHFSQLGNLLLTFVMFWTYIVFGQLLIIWAGNLPHEINWYIPRIAGGWKWVVVFLALFNFFVPFFLLLFREVKRRVAALACIAAMVFVAHLVSDYWLVAPSFYRAGIQLHWMEFAMPLGIGGIWMALFVRNLGRGGMLPKNDPRIELSPAYVH